MIMKLIKKKIIKCVKYFCFHYSQNNIAMIKNKTLIILPTQADTLV